MEKEGSRNRDWVCRRKEGLSTHVINLKHEFWKSLKLN